MIVVDLARHPRHSFEEECSGRYLRFDGIGDDGEDEDGISLVLIVEDGGVFSKVLN